MEPENLKTVVLSALAIPTVAWASIYAATNLYMQLAGPVDLKKKYKAEWALVTGAGTGIGKSIAETMAVQGLNVVLVSLPDKFLEETTNDLKKRYPNLKFRAVPAKFDHKTDYMPAIIEVRR
jgi:predicted GTPase